MLKEQLIVERFTMIAVQKSAAGIVGVTLCTEGPNISGTG